MKTLKSYTWQLINEPKGYLIDKEDEGILKKYYTLSSDKDNKYRIVTDLYPEPYIGNPDTAKVVLLGLNPGYAAGNGDKSTKDKKRPKPFSEYEWYEEYGDKIKDILLDNLTHNVTKYPFYYDNPGLREKSPGHDWREKKISQLQKEIKEKHQIEWEEISSKFLQVQYFPYHSNKFTPQIDKNGEIVYLPSQKYNFELVLDQINKGKLVICMRSVSLWIEALLKHSEKGFKLSKENFIILKNKRQPYLTKPDKKNKGNMREEEFKRLVNVLTEK